mmetsp:Transcript_1083/g.2677  ORF Transcript_1083/g.2677 Transcript_1083/m.2677 type:complete len:242 (+) Transcript_1083:60-785(+)
MSRAPHEVRERATLHPSVPAPRSRHLVVRMRSVSRSGRKRHRMSFKFRSADSTARILGSMKGARSTWRAPIFPRALASHPTTVRGASSGAGSVEREMSRTMSGEGEGGAAPGEGRCRRQRTRAVGMRRRRWRRKRRFRSGQPGLEAREDGSTNPNHLSVPSSTSGCASSFSSASTDRARASSAPRSVTKKKGGIPFAPAPSAATPASSWASSDGERRSAVGVGSLARVGGAGGHSAGNANQ